MSRLPIRARLAAAFALAMVVMLAAAALFVYLRLKTDLDESVTAGLETRAASVAASGQASAGAAGEDEEGFAQIVATDGVVEDSAGGAGSRSALTPGSSRVPRAARRCSSSGACPASRRPRGCWASPLEGRRS